MRAAGLAALTLAAALAPPSAVLRAPPPPPSAAETPRQRDLHWDWKGLNVRYTKHEAEGQSAGVSVVLVHGFGGNADHWRRNAGPLAAAGCDVFAIDLLGYGLSDKVSPDALAAMGINGETSRLAELLELPQKYV